VAVGVWGTAVRKEVHDLVGGFLVSGEVIPEPGHGQYTFLCRSQTYLPTW